MKILFVIPSLGGGGQEKAGMIITNYLAQFHDVTVVAFEPPTAGDYAYKSPVKRIEIKRGNSKVSKSLVVLKRITALRKIKKQWKPDVTIAIGPTAIIVNSLSFGKDQKISSIRQSLLQLNNNRLFNKLLFSISGKLVPVHNGINEEFFKLYKIKNNLFAYNGYDIEKINADTNEPVETSLRSFFDHTVLSHMSRFDSQKCNWHIVKLFHLARKKMPTLKLMLIGDVDNSNPLNKSIYQFCGTYLRSNGYKVKMIAEDMDAPAEAYDVLMLGHKMNPHKYLAKSDLFIFPSAWEGFPNALVEAMACGLPVISADCPTGPKEILVDDATGEKYGILMPVFNHHFNATDISTNELHREWADEIVTLLENKDQLDLYAKRSVKRASDFSVEKSCKKWLDIIENKIN